MANGASIWILLAIALAGVAGWLLLLRRQRTSSELATNAESIDSAPHGEPIEQVTTLAMLDIDDLKGVNVTADFDTGDRLLNAVGDVLLRAVPDGAELERLDSGRFLVWLPDVPLDRAARTAERMRMLGSQALVDGPDGRVARTLSAGLVPTASNESRARAILRADIVLANAKRIGGNRTETARHQPMPSLLPSREQIEEAIDTRALEYHVQPIFDLRTMTPAGVEALLRWNRPDGAVLGPNGFMDTLDRIPEVGVDLFPDLAVEAATPFVTGAAPIYATFNITGAVLDGTNSPGCRWLSIILERLPPENLVLELVETAVIVNPERASDLIGRLRAKGVRIALDDFGAGLSNLERLRQFPVDILKVDRAFVDGLGGSGREEAILASLVALAGGLDINVIAEGIETEAQAQTVTDLGINYGQGYHLGRPAPASDWAAWMAEGL